MKVTIRLAKPDEIEEIVDLQALSLSNLGYKEYTEQQLNAIIKSQKQARLMQDDEILYVAESPEGNILGFGAFIQTHINAGRITGIYVTPTYLGKGIGTQIIQTIENKALQNGILQLDVYCSLNSVNFYHKKGYYLVTQRGEVSVLLDETVISCKLLYKQLRPLNLIEKTFSMFSLFLIIVIFSLLLITIASQLWEFFMFVTILFALWLLNRKDKT
jgi:putative acetyltransferase